jgi:hypothetical protein
MHGTAYFARTVCIAQKVFMKLATGVDHMKLFFTADDETK